MIVSKTGEGELLIYKSDGKNGFVNKEEKAKNINKYSTPQEMSDYVMDKLKPLLKAKEENKEWRCEGGYKFCQKDDQGKCSCKQPSESKEIDKIIDHLTKEFAVHSHGTSFLVMKLIDAYQQLQARVNELEKSEMILLETINGERMQHKKEVEYLESKLKELENWKQND